ncbi:MAG: nucleotidyl transferase AbiEii/AbiGii toxin family protein [Candidatus Pacebacteria bacterium]|nr:nucleotidyl transferase AbiEii/AbiGii toxin family protein [Candidatus Paceibacterota bacterium]MDD5013066.1 nucleotidyl transferase AbiEii/AbiGii toxin family protein [Candidatus Paceibacterota bacterium]MDD5752977.1 nucleotidyl transferase AbiEii/AbiGii toxin family protein [Candidatus Paceibacterota bacterium]
MLNKEKHQLIMGQILKDIYSDNSIASLLGFKGGTCAYFFYGLNRFSVDLDFDLFLTDEQTKLLVFEKIEGILAKYGEVKSKQIKRFTIFLLLSYGKEDHNIKIEISTRNIIPNIKDYYDLKEYLSISMMVANPIYLFSGKLAAIPLRQETAMRDIYDFYYFAKNNWDIDKKIVELFSEKTFLEHINDCIKTVEMINENQILHGLGELINEKEKNWVKQNLKKESLFFLKNYESVHRRSING